MTPRAMPNDVFLWEARRSSTAPSFGIHLEQFPGNDQIAGSGRIRCPLCGWTPRSEDRWTCLCGCLWNTFETRGRCPECGSQWLKTQCLACSRWSPHEDWYADAEPAS